MRQCILHIACIDFAPNSSDNTVSFVRIGGNRANRLALRPNLIPGHIQKRGGALSPNPLVCMFAMLVLAKLLILDGPLFIAVCQMLPKRVCDTFVKSICKNVEQVLEGHHPIPSSSEFSATTNCKLIAMHFRQIKIPSILYLSL